MKGFEAAMLANCYQKSLLSVFALLVTLLASSAVLAATWQGPYVGAYVGGGFGRNHASTDVGTVNGASYFTTSADINAVNSAGTWVNDPQSVIAGIQAGHDWVWKQMVYGVAADYGLLPLSSRSAVTKVFSDNSSNYSIFTSMSTNWLLTLRGRLGYQAVLRWPSLLYLTGGMAITQLRVNNSYNDSSSLLGRGGSNASENQIGWTAGAGFELASFGRATLDLEYMYVRIPSVKVSSSISNSVAGFGVPLHSLTSPFTTTGDFHASLFRLGLNYRFDE